MVRVLLIAAAVLSVARPGAAQIPAHNSAGVAAGHEHFRATDIAAAERFWTSLGGVITPMGQVRVIKFPGVIVMLQGVTPDNPITGGMEGSTTDTILFKVKDLKATLSSLEAAGYKSSQGPGSRSALVMGPENARVQLVEDRSLTGVVATDSLVMKVADPAAAAAWYGKWFGATVAERDGAIYADIPGMNMRFEKPSGAVSGGRGRALDHIGFDVVNLEAFMQKLAAGGVTISRPYSPAPALVKPVLTSLAFVTDPWGTAIELNEGFAGVK